MIKKYENFITESNFSDNKIQQMIENAFLNLWDLDSKVTVTGPLYADFRGVSNKKFNLRERKEPTEFTNKYFECIIPLENFKINEFVEKNKFITLYGNIINAIDELKILTDRFYIETIREFMSVYIVLENK